MDKINRGNVCIGCNANAGARCSTCQVWGGENVPIHEQIRAKKDCVRRVLSWALARTGGDCPICGGGGAGGFVYLNRDWLGSLSTVELVDWIKNTASAMSDAELLKWLEEKHGK